MGETVSRRTFVVVLAGGVTAAISVDSQAETPPGTIPCSISINRQKHQFLLDPRDKLFSFNYFVWIDTHAYSSFSHQEFDDFRIV